MTKNPHRRRDPDVLRADRGRGRLSGRADREVREFNDTSHPRKDLTPFVELEVMDERVALAGEDENKTHFDPDVHPKAHSRGDPDEPVCDADGRVCDIQVDTPSVDVVSLSRDTVDQQGDLMTDTPSIDRVTTGPDPTEEQGDLMFDTKPIEVDLGINL